MAYPRRTRSAVGSLLLPAIIVVLLLASGLAAARLGSGPPDRAIGGPLSSPSTPGLPVPSHVSVLSSLGAGDVARSVFVNYNASWQRNFISSVNDWTIGPGAYVPSTGYLWLSDLSTNAVAGPEPKLAPALLYDPTNNSFAGVVNQLANTSDLLYDPANGFLYATLPLTASVGVFNPTSYTMVGSPIPVGTDPSAMVLDNSTGDLIVANAGSANLTLINTTSDLVIPSTIATDLGPAGLAIDPAAQTLFVACENSNFVDVFNSTSFASIASFHLGGHPGGIAFSPEREMIAVTVPSQGSVTILNASAATFWKFWPGIGGGVHSVAPTLNGSDFLLAMSTAANLQELDPLNGTVINAAIGVGEYPGSFDTIPSSATLFVWCSGSRNLSSVTLAGISTVAASPDLGMIPDALAFDAVSGRVVVADSHDSSLGVLSPLTLNSVAAPLGLNATPLSLSADAASGVVYVGLEDGVAAFDPATDTVVATNFTLGGAAEAIQVDVADNVLWVLNSLHGLIAYTLPNLAASFSPGIGAGQTGIHTLALDPRTDQIFLSVNTSGTSDIAVVDASNGTVVNTSLAPAPGLTSLAYDPADGDVYGLGTNVTLLNATSLVLAGPTLVVAPHTESGAIAYDPSREDLFAATMNSPTSGTVTVIDGSSTDASYEGVAAMAVGQSPVAVLPVTLSTGELAGTSEVWVANSGSGTVSLIANSPPKIDGFAAAPDLIDAGQSTTFVLTYSGGAGPSVVSYPDLPAGCTSTNASELVCTPTATGTFTVVASVTDALGNSAQASTNLTVRSGLSIVPFIAPGDFPDLELGMDLGIYPTVVGGVAPYHYAWSFGDGTGSTTQNVTHAYDVTGVYLLQLNVTDQVGGTGTVAWLVDVYPPPTIELVTSTLKTDIAASVSFNTVETGGIGSGTTFWSFGDGTLATGSNATHSWTSAGHHLVTATYQDKLGDEANATVTVQVNDTPAGEFVVTGGTLANPARPGTLFFYNVTLSGGTGPFTVVWNFGDGSEGAGARATHSYSSAGNFTVSSTATDAAGVTVNATLSIVVLPPLSSSSSSGGSSLTFPLGIFLGIVVGATVAAIAVYAVGGRKRKPKSPPPPSPYVPPRKAVWKED